MSNIYLSNFFDPSSGFLHTLLYSTVGDLLTLQRGGNILTYFVDRPLRCFLGYPEFICSLCLF